MTTDDDRAAVANALCTQCGLCCDGTFFGAVVVAADERERLGRVGLPILERDGALSLPQPCSALRGCLCSVYAERPRACAKYECSLRGSILAGETSEASAQLSVARMRALLALVRASFDIGEASLWEAILALDEPEVLPDPQSPAGRKLDAGLKAVAELLEVARAVFEPAIGTIR